MQHLWMGSRGIGNRSFVMSRQEVASPEECRKIKDCGSLREDFYTKFKQKNKDLGLWHGWKENILLVEHIL